MNASIENRIFGPAPRLIIDNVMKVEGTFEYRRQKKKPINKWEKDRFDILVNNAGIVVFLSSEKAHWITGQRVGASGGMFL